MTKIRYRRAYIYVCITCGKKRKTLVFSRYVKKVCMKCKRSAIVAGQEPLFKSDIPTCGRCDVPMNPMYDNSGFISPDPSKRELTHYECPQCGEKQNGNNN